jgi:hypothetical protein
MPVQILTPVSLLLFKMVASSLTSFKLFLRLPITIASTKAIQDLLIVKYHRAGFMVV